ncbi:DNA cytosine methyltransferase [Duganella sp.]|uniref:DNA cytosine methyltransferase n=1 Tax=Duganella sp. TaxID=1904440 RepID=UPI0031D9644F
MKRDNFTLPLDLGHELIIDNFAGGGGTSTGLEAAFGRPVDIAINHDPEALAMHALNHPYTRHLCESVWDVDPIEVTGNRPVALVWLSPDCKHFSKAKGGTPVSKKIRGLAWVAMRWAAKCKPRVIMLENVEEFKTWGPLIVGTDGKLRPDPAKKGKTFASFVRQLKGHGYSVEFREIRASDYNTPTIRKRLFMVARRDGLPIAWPDQSHGAPNLAAVASGQLQPHRTAAECIDFSLPCPSIFERDKPLAEATLRRIAKGIMRYVIDAGSPFIVPVTHQGSDRVESIDEPFRTITGANRGEKAISVATLVQTGYGERAGQSPRAMDIEKPLGTVVAGASKAALVSAFLTEHAQAANQRVMPADEPLRTICAQVKGGHFSLVSAHITKFRTGATGSSMDEPVPTITAGPKENPAGSPHALGIVTSSLIKLRGTSTGAGLDEPLHTVSADGQHHAEVRAFLLKYYGTDQDPRLEEPLHTVTTKDRYGLVTIHGVDYQIVDIGLRMLQPKELYAAQGFPSHYQFEEIPDPTELFNNGKQVDGDPRLLPRRKLSKSAQVRMCGNSVCPPVAEALIRANFSHERTWAYAA